MRANAASSSDVNRDQPSLKDSNRLLRTGGRMMNDCSCMAYVYRWLIWASRNVQTETQETDHRPVEDEKQLKMLRPAQPGPCQVEAASAVGRPSCQKDAAAAPDTSATRACKARL